MWPALNAFTDSLFLLKTINVNASRNLFSIGQLPKLANQSESVFHLFLVSYWLHCCSSQFPIVEGVVLGLIGRRLMSLPFSNSRGNSCTTQIPITSRATLAALENCKLLVSTLSIFQRKYELESFKCESHRNFKGHWKLRGEFSFFKSTSLVLT
jgi:hypothetical protein